jgi:uncharacterized protein (TIGR03067 family)
VAGGLSVQPQQLLLEAASGVPHPTADTRAEVKKFQGAWRTVKLERAGETVADGPVPGARFVADGDALLFQVSGNTLLNVRFTVRPSKKPAEIDLTSVAGPTRGQTVCGIYRFEGKRLTLCWPLGKGGKRPGGFGGKGNGDVATLTLERE